MNILFNKNISSNHLANLNRSYNNEQSNNDNKTYVSLFDRFKRWFHSIKQWKYERLSQGQLVLNNNNHINLINKNEIMRVNDIPFIIPRQIEDVRKQIRPNFQRAKLLILRMDEYLVSSEDKTKAKRRRHQDTSLGLRALAEAIYTVQKIAFREVLSIDETLPIIGRNLPDDDDDDDGQENRSMHKFYRQKGKIDPITDFHEVQDFVAFDRALTKHRMDILEKPTYKPSDMIYLKFCLMLEIQRDEYESCLRIILHDIIFKYHLADFHLRCEIHVRKPMEREFVLDRIVHDSHLKANYSVEFVLWSGDWIAQQEVELYVVMKIESLSINKYISSKFWDMAHLHVKNIPHGSSRIFLRELTPVSRPHKLLSRTVNIGQVEIEAAYWPTSRQLSIHIVKVTHLQAERLLRTSDTYVEIIFQSPFDIYDIKRTKVADRSLNPIFNEEFYFKIPRKIAISDITIDLIFLEKSSLHHHHSIVHGVLTLSKHTDWYPNMDTTGTEMTSISLNTTTKHRDPPPLNVYLRLRPFISDEFERGENQKLIDILDDKHITVKLYPTINNTIRTQQTSYNEYQVTRIFNQYCTQQELFEQILEQPTNEIFTGSNWLFCTLGLTNSGKTHTMFGTNDEPGLIPKCLRRIFLNVGQNIDNKVLFKPVGLENVIPTIDCDLKMEISVRNYIFKEDKYRIRLPHIVQKQNSFDDFSIEGLDEHYSIWISFFELYNENILDLLVQPKDMKTRKNLRLLQNDHSTIIKNLIQIPVFDIKEAEDIIKFGFANRSTSKTNLNEASSRSHAIICITLITINEFDEDPTMSHMYICDLAGNEPSTGTGKQLTETCNINTSLMTFKDCIRVLNENQTAKKQMLVPYRNSVLTSIFRPYFVGRGRTIICCNINPCATFITQTNELMKFCALAQKTIIVQNESKIGTAIIRQQRKSKNKGPKRLGRQSLSKVKHLSNNDELEELGESSMITPSNVKSISYWKYYTKKAVDLLQKQASNRRIFMIERYQERIQTIQYLLHQRQQNEQLIKEKQSITKQNEILLKNLRLEQDNHSHTQQLYDKLILNENQYRQKLFKLEKEYQEDNRNTQDEINSLKKQLKILQEQFDRLTNEHIKTIEQNDQDKHEYQEREQYLQGEI
ncbi:unnamed protein product, partial [Adineta steineri]